MHSSTESTTSGTSISEQMGLSMLVTTPDQWAALSSQEREDLTYWLSEVMKDPNLPLSGTRHFRETEYALMAEDGAARFLPQWIKDSLLELLGPPPQVNTPISKVAPVALTDSDKAKSGDAIHRPLVVGLGDCRDVRELASGIEYSRSMASSRFKAAMPWPEDCFGLPNVIARSALMSSSKGAMGFYGRTRDDLAPVASLKKATIFARGRRLCQWDNDVFLMSLHAARFGAPVEMSPADFLRGMDRGASQRDVEVLLASLKRLRECFVQMTYIRYPEAQDVTWSGSLIQALEIVPKASTPDGGRGRLIRLTLDPALAQFIGNDVTWISIKARAALRRHALAAGLYAFYVTHADPHDYRIETIRELLGVRVKGKEYERLLRAALALLENLRFAETWRIFDGKLAVAWVLTLTKARHLEKKGATAHDASQKIRVQGTAPQADAVVVISAVMHPLKTHIRRILDHLIVAGRKILLWSRNTASP
jgi:hypothetical protein